MQALHAGVSVLEGVLSAVVVPALPDCLYDRVMYAATKMCSLMAV